MVLSKHAAQKLPLLGISMLMLKTTFAIAGSLSFLRSTALGPDPHSINRLNGESFQQDALASFNGYQYAVLWQPSPTNASVRQATVSRRPLASSTHQFESLVLTDYNQTEDDGHDIISIGISPTDGTLHLIFDQHDNPLHYRTSIPGVTTNPESVKWSPALFGPIIEFLPGLDTLDKSTHFINITYPRFLAIPPAAHPPSHTSSLPSSSSQSSPDLLLELRVGRSGLGDDWIYHYYPGSSDNQNASPTSGNLRTGKWVLVGRYLLGVNNNAYINGLDFDSRRILHTTWTYRDFINDTGKDVAVQAGPNGPENNHDLNYAFSPDLGYTWQNTWGQIIANLRNTPTSNITSTTFPNSGGAIDDVAEDVEPGTPIQPNSAGIVIFGIPKFGGILNQESQTVDPEGRVHVLNRENTTGVEQWYHYWRSTGTPAHWTRTPLPLSIANDVNNVTGTPTVIGKRGKIVALASQPNKVNPSSTKSSSQVSLLAILPSNAANSSAITILESTALGHFRDWSVAWQAPSGCGWEPLFDRYRVGSGSDGVLSLYLVNGTSVTVVDLDTK